MDSVDLEVLKRCAEWLESGRRVLLVTVVKTWGSSPRPPGAMLAVRDDGLVEGSVSGGCVEDDLVGRRDLLGRCGLARCNLGRHSLFPFSSWNVRRNHSHLWGSRRNNGSENTSCEMLP